MPKLQKRDDGHKRHGAFVFRWTRRSQLLVHEVRRRNETYIYSRISPGSSPQRDSRASRTSTIGGFRSDERARTRRAVRPAGPIPCFDPIQSLVRIGRPAISADLAAAVVSHPPRSDEQNGLVPKTCWIAHVMSDLGLTKSIAPNMREYSLCDLT
jgi:hypothetical protein